LVFALAFALISVEGSLKASIEATDLSAVAVVLTNADRFEPLVFCTWGTPLDTLKNTFRSYAFSVANNVSGEQAEYIGILTKRHPVLTDFVTLQPGQSIKTTVDLFQGYYFPSAGVYSIVVDTSIRVHLGELEVNAINEHGFSDFGWQQLTSNTVSVGVVAPPAAPYWGPLSNDSLVGGPTPRANCNADQAAQIRTSGSNAVLASQQGSRYLPASCSSSLSYYIRWFGQCDSSRFSKVKTDLAAITNGLNANYPVDCAGSSCTANTYAYVYPSDTTHTVYVCGYFWRVPTRNCVLDSQPGTLIHEMSHFNNVASTSDVTYGITNCENLARNNPNQAVRNADNFCFYTDSCPTL